MRHERLFRWWFAFCAAAAVAWLVFLIWAITQGIDILRLWALS